MNTAGPPERLCSYHVTYVPSASLTTSTPGPLEYGDGVPSAVSSNQTLSSAVLPHSTCGPLSVGADVSWGQTTQWSANAGLGVGFPVEAHYGGGRSRVVTIVGYVPPNFNTGTAPGATHSE